MMITKYGTGTLFGAIHDYLIVYLPKQRNMSMHTQNSYRKSLELLVDFVKDRTKVRLQDVTFEMLTTEMVSSFLDSLETDRGNEISTRNTRLAAVKAFTKYAADRNVVNVAILQGLKNVAVKKPNKVETIAYMSMAAITAIVEQTDATSLLGSRDRTLLILLYDTGARVQELIDIKLCDLRHGKNPTVTLHGKGGNVRTLPLLEKTTQHLSEYLLNFHANVSPKSDAPLFYAVTHGKQHPLSDRRIRYLIESYAHKARPHCCEVPENVSPHMFRHSRAMHLYQKGMDLTLVSEWLGHARLETTRIYAHADTEHKRTAIAKATPADSPLSTILNSERLTISDEETLKLLTGLRKKHN